MSTPYSFPKKEKLVSRKTIDWLFSSSESKSISAFPLRLVYAASPPPSVGGRDADCTQMLISVPKRCFKHAVDRNRIKRQVREAYRLHKDSLPQDEPLALAFIWLDHSHHDTKEVETKMVKLLSRVKAVRC